MRSKGNGRKYEYEFGRNDYERLVRFVSGLKGRVLLIGYDGGLMGAGLLGWQRREMTHTNSAGSDRSQHPQATA